VLPTLGLVYFFSLFAKMVCNEEKKEEAGQESANGNWFEGGVQSLTTIFTSLFPSSMDDAGVILGVGPKNDNNDESESREQKATQVCCFEREHVQTLTGSQDVGPLLLLLPDSTQHCQACMLKVANVFRGCLRAVCLEGTREEAEVESSSNSTQRQCSTLANISFEVMTYIHT